MRLKLYTTLLRQFSLSKSDKVLRLIDRRQSFRNPIPFIVIFDTTLAFFSIIFDGVWDANLFAICADDA